MTASTTARIAENVPGGPFQGTLPSAANQLFLKNCLVAINGSGEAVVPTDGDGFPVIGWAKGTYDNRTGSEAGGAAGDIQIEIHYGVIEVVCADTVEEGDALYSVDNQTVSASDSAGARALAGYASEQRNGATYLATSPLTAYLQTLEARITALEP